MLLMILTGLAWTMQIMSMMKFLINYGVNFGSFIGLTALLIPFIISIIVPFVTFIAIIFVYNKTIADNEVSVMMASGLSPWQLAKPAIRFAAILTALNLVLNLWVVPISQNRFYDTQWNLRYGLAHLKLQESAFTNLSNGLVVYVDKVSGHDMSQVMLSDARNPKTEMVIFAETGKLVTTPRGLSIVMENGSLQARNDSVVTGTFDTFDMDLNVATRENSGSFRVRRISSVELLKYVDETDNIPKYKRMVLNELSNRTLMPFMNLILAIVCSTILLKTSVLRRRASFSPAMAVLAMALIMTLYMTSANMLDSWGDFYMLAGGIFVLLGASLMILHKK
ncbi:MAG: LptF/LptG family permease [Alphaproteobacteria bacterium]|nr:LptF/LptG family permease [Alphaproteobacteria bacterium]